MRPEGPEGRRKDIFGVAILAAMIALVLAFGAQRGRRAATVAARSGDVTSLGGPLGRYTLFPTSGRVEAASVDGRSRLDLEMSLVVDGAERPLVMRRGDVVLKDKNTLAGELPIEIGDERASGLFELRMDPQTDIVTVSLAVTEGAPSAQTNAQAGHTYALRVGVAPEGRSVFVPGSGEISDVATLEGHAVVVDDDTHPFALFSGQGALAIAEVPPDTSQPGARPRLVVTARSERATRRGAAKPMRLEVSVLSSDSSQQIWGRLHRLLRPTPVGKVSGVVTGTKERAHIYALDEEGHPQIRAIADAQGTFTIEAPQTAVQWYAALEAVHTSAPVRFTPGTPWDLKLDVSPGGELHVKVTDADTGQPVIARLLVKGIDGSIDPSFGPDFRASGAGPLMDMLSGEVKTPLPAGRYRVSATKGIEWSIDAEVVQITSGHPTAIELALRHVVPTPGMVGCDLHVHARPSFDSPVLPEDRVLSLVSAGVDFAVPTEHNIVGDYSAAIELLKVGKQFATVPGVEITTYNPRFGHFGVFPYPVGPSVPPYRGTNAGAVIAGSRRGDPSRVVQMHHPRLPNGIGYLTIAGFDPKGGRIPAGMRTDFDTIEVYNGFDFGARARIDQVLDDWYALLNLGKHMYATASSDSHRVQYQWAGYPRTYALVEPRFAGDTGQAIDTKEVVAAIKKGRSFMSGGPIIEVDLGDGPKPARPGDEVVVPSGRVLGGKLKVRAAPWVDVTSVDVIAGIPAHEAGAGAPAGTVVPATIATLYQSKPASRPTQLGKEQGTLAEAAARTVRLDADLALTVPHGARWIVVVVRGDRSLDDALPFMVGPPLAFTNPIWIAK